ncbi:MAG TPA: VTT domain-containing protein [Verrucomicrobiae bacterium]|nr:VTT domain-containing protein [Verrucomicrobiae bacterium]
MTEAIPLTSQVAADWLPLWKAAGFFFATFILEDVAAIGAGLLLASGQISWPAAFLSCFLGIWLGDVGLYTIARVGGRRWFEQSRLAKHTSKVSRSEQWFTKRGTPILIFSRLMPGARLPTYLAAGFLRLPLPRFLRVTGTASFAWTIVVLRASELFGAKVFAWFNTYKYGGFLLVGAGVGTVVLIQLVRRAASTFEWRKLARLRHWEFWPAWMFYLPVAIYCVWLAIKYRGLTLPTAANPGMFSGGLVGESKQAILKELFATSPEFVAESGLIASGDISERMASLDRQIEALKLGYPFILKPDLGQRGVGIKLIRTRAQTQAYLEQTDAPLIIQRYAPGPREAGIFYYRFPSEQRGRIFAITEKIFPTLMGDGRSTIAELIQQDARAALIGDTYLRRFKARCDEVLADGEELRLVEAGNHAQGCIFRDGLRLKTSELEARIDEISRKLTGFFIGRYDVRFANEADLRAGKNFQIIELNGAASEATNIYDSSNSLWSAYRTLFRQWDLVFAIGAANRARGIMPTKVAPVWKAWRNYTRLAASYPTAD